MKIRRYTNQGYSIIKRVHIVFIHQHLLYFHHIDISYKGRPIPFYYVFTLSIMTFSTFHLSTVQNLSGDISFFLPWTADFLHGLRLLYGSLQFDQILNFSQMIIAEFCYQSVLWVSTDQISLASDSKFPNKYNTRQQKKLA